MNSNQSRPIRPEKLKTALGQLFGLPIIRADYQAKPLHGGTLGDVRLVTGTAVTADGEKRPYRLVAKAQRQWERYGDAGSWRREYDLYASGFGGLFEGPLRWPACYHAEMTGDRWEIWMEYIEGVSGAALTNGMRERAAQELGRFQGMLYAERPDILKSLANLGHAGAMKDFYRHYRSWPRVYDSIRSANCGIPKRLREMIIDADERADDIWARVEALPVVFCHRDFWDANLFVTGHEVVLIDWDTAGWGYLGEDMVSLIADEAAADSMPERYQKCVPAYRRGFSERAGISPIANLYIWERVVLHFGYRLVEAYLNARAESSLRDAGGAQATVHTLQKIYEMSDIHV